MLSIFEDGLGGGAIGVPVWALTVTSFAGSGLALDTPRGAWVAVYWWSFLAVLMLACAIPTAPSTQEPPRMADQWTSRLLSPAASVA